jgi:hypothetical protein
MWELKASQDSPPRPVEGRFIVCFDDYIAAMRSPSANGDELMTALASIYFGVRIVIMGSRQRTRENHLFWDAQADYHPPNVHRARHIILVHTPGHYQWAHPHRDDCFGVSAGIGRISGRIRFDLDEWFESWSREPRAFTAQAYAAAGRRWNAAGGCVAPGDSPNCVIGGTAADTFVADWPAPVSPQQQKPFYSQGHATVDPVTLYKWQAPELVQRAKDLGHTITLGDAAAALHFTRDVATGQVDMECAATFIPGGVNNPLTLDSPPSPRAGKRAQQNAVKRAARVKEAANANSQIDQQQAQDGDADEHLQDFSEKDASENQQEQERRCLCPHIHHCPCPHQVDKHSRSKTSKLSADVPAVNRSLADEIQLKQTAVETVVALTGADVNTATRRLEYHLVDTTNIQDAITACCRDLHPAARTLSFVEENLGEGVRPLTVRETAKHLAQVATRAPGSRDEGVVHAALTPPSALHPVNLNQRFLHSAAQHLRNPDLTTLPHAQRLAVATNRATREQWDEAIDQRTWKRDFNTPRSDTEQPRKPELCSHPSPAVRMAAAREQNNQEQQARGAATPVVVIGGGSTKLPTWQPGEESQNRGFYWSTKQHIQHAWRQYMLAEGQFAPRTFKSLISQQLVPTICAETDIPLADWDHISDRVLLEKIESRLRPKNSTDVINRLCELSISKDTSKGTLSQRYRLFAEAYLQRLAEAQECGCVLTESAIKRTFQRAVRQEPALESWISEEKWTSVWDAHRRIVEHLREYDAWAVYDHMQRGTTAPHTQGQQEDTAKSTPASGKPDIGQKRGWDGSRNHQSFSNALAAMIQQMGANSGAANYQGAEPPRGNFPPAQPAREFRQQPNVSPRDPAYNYMHPGLDARGLNWHHCTEFIKCRETPCTGLFCQVCGFHGHTARTCQKRAKQIPGINLHGYFQESKPNCHPVRYENMQAGGGASHQFHAPPQAHFTAPPANTAPIFPHFVNSTTPRTNTAPRTSTPHPERQDRVSRSNQTQEGGGAARDSSGPPTTQ